MRLTGPMLLSALLACGDPPASPDATLRVLFIGNSLTYVNDLPALVANIARADGGVRIEVQDESQPAYALEDHWNRPATLAALDAGGWDVVVLQQGPSSLPENALNLRQWAVTFADRIRRQGGRPALFMVWPEDARRSAFDAVRQAYRDAAIAANGDFYPAGEAWRRAWDVNPNLLLYGNDGFHPSALGSYLAALTIYCGLTGRPPAEVTGLALPDETAQLFRRAAAEAITQYGRSATPAAVR